MLINGLILQILLILFVATLVRSAFGFGEALIAVPLLALIIPIEVAAPLAVLISITVAAIVLMQDWRDVHFKSAGHLVLSSLAGIPFGLLLLTTTPEPIVKIILAAIIFAFSLYSLLNQRGRRLKSDRWAWLFGLGAGALGGAYGMNGPPLVVYGTLRKWSPSRFRATLQGYFLPASIMVMAGYWLAGLWTERVTRYYLLTLPAVIIAVYAGRYFNRQLKEQKFIHYIHIILLIIALMLFLTAINGYIEIKSFRKIGNFFILL